GCLGAWVLGCLGAWVLGCLGAVMLSSCAVRCSAALFVGKCRLKRECEYLFSFRIMRFLFLWKARHSW
ncbi:hypothetical protein, partial [Candidatus Anaplasma sp. TIGMIC]|uniref:hypothetical protein n=1 Tax=Candidatus Anaplasma sp. TIGMIC TaxID=3020713 RepID=UPI00232EAECE